MAASNSESNLVDEFEEAFQMCLLSLTKQEPNTGTSKEEIELDVQRTTNRFIDVARQMEAFFLQKRFIVSTLKPAYQIKDENQDLRSEIQRKEALLNKHYNRLEEWKACLSDAQQGQGHNRPPGGPPSCHVPQPGPGIQLPPGQHLQSQLQQQKIHQQMQQLRMMGKHPKQN